MISVAFETAIGLVVALVLNADFKGRARPRRDPDSVGDPDDRFGPMWGWMMNDQFGILNDIFVRLGILSHPIAWAAQPDTAMIAVLIVDIWKTTPFMSLLILAGLQMVPNDIYEAAKIDGIHPVKVFLKVTLPLVRPALLVAVIFRALDALRIFDLIYVLTPNNEKTISMSVFARQNLFEFDKFAYGSALDAALRHHRHDHHSLHVDQPPEPGGRPMTMRPARCQIRPVLSADRGDRRLRGVPVLLRDPDLAQIGHGAVQGRLLADELLARQLHLGHDQGQFPAQSRQLAGRLARRWWRCSWPSPRPMRSRASASAGGPAAPDSFRFRCSRRLPCSPACSR